MASDFPSRTRKGKEKLTCDLRSQGVGTVVSSRLDVWRPVALLAVDLVVDSCGADVAVGKAVPECALGHHSYTGIVDYSFHGIAVREANVKLVFFCFSAICCGAGCWFPSIALACLGDRGCGEG